MFVAVTLILGATEHWTAFGLTVLGFLVAGSVISRRNSPSKLQRPLINQLAIISLGFAAVSAFTTLFSVAENLGFKTMFLVFYATSLLIFGSGFFIDSRTKQR
ncbi:MAG: hypothetical protein Q4F64_08350 [Corynebacterium casei]|nr:hypothetical protein [Corynebacterium casei]